MPHRNRSNRNSRGVKNNSNKLIRDHVSTYGKDIKQATNQKFGINNSLIIKAATGDERACKQIADMGHTGERLALAMPVITKHLKNYIGGIREYNTGLAEVYKEGSKGALAIDKTRGNLTLENTRYQNLREEYKAKLFADLKAEYERHDDAMDSIELRAWVDSHVREVEAFATQEDISNVPFLKQIEADRALSQKRMMHWLNYGENSNTNYIPVKQYVTAPIQGFWDRVRGIFTN